MTKFFRKETGERVDVIKHTLEQIALHPTLSIRIGTDSQNFAEKTRYVTSVVYRYGLRGAHCVFFKEDVSKIKDHYLRLYEEGVRTITIYELISAETSIQIEALEFDYANIKKTKSSRLVESFKGWVMSLNQIPVFKSGEMFACKYSDHICRR